jgi:hypothetical protein
MNLQNPQRFSLRSSTDLEMTNHRCFIRQPIGLQVRSRDIGNYSTCDPLSRLRRSANRRSLAQYRLRASMLRPPTTRLGRYDISGFNIHSPSESKDHE